MLPRLGGNPAKCSGFMRQIQLNLWKCWGYLILNTVDMVNIYSEFLPWIHWIALDICWNPLHVEHRLNAGEQCIYK
jgi:hypothetical protein